ncbi:MAG: glycosyltransferase family 2 protein [Butyrivibrio sp.]|nr:glycosyltransferase family 2 protein [Butyrivibrio sp.]
MGIKVLLYRIKKGFGYLRHYGPRKFAVRLKERLKSDRVSYAPWLKKHAADEGTLQRQREDCASWESRPLFSVCVPLYGTPKSLLADMLESVRAQSYDNWELCLADGTEDSSVEEALKELAAGDGRVKYIRVANNGIAGNTNAAIELSSGEWLGFLDHDDILAPDCLYEVLAAAGANTVRASRVIRDGGRQAEADAVYTDEDKISFDGKKHFQPHFKPDYSIDLLRSNNYITHFFAVKKSLADRAGGFRGEFDGAQDYDFIFRCTRLAKRVAHMPRVLYHWRASANSTADNPESKKYAFEAGRRAIEADLEARGLRASVEQSDDYGFYRVKYEVIGSPTVSIIIPNKDETDTLRKCIASIQKSTYANYEIIIVENNSVTEEIKQYYEELTGQKYDAGKELSGKLPTGADIKIVTWRGAFNYSAINNFGSRYAGGEYLVLLNNDIELLNPEWLEEFLGCCQRGEVGIVGAKLIYPDETVQHAGIVVGIGGIAGNMFVNLPADFEGYMHKASVQLNCSAVTAACLMIKTEVFCLAGGLTEELEVAFNDVDLCLKAREKGFLVVYNPKVLAYHYESKSRGHEDSPEKLERFDREIAYIRSRWREYFTDGDPFYNRNLSLKKQDYSLKEI